MGKEKKKRSKKRKILLVSLIILGVLILAGGIVALVMYLKYLPVLKWKEKNDFMMTDTGFSLVGTTLTEEQRLKDFDYMYDLVCLQNPKKELFEQVYGVSYEEIYQQYRNYVLHAKTEYEYYSYLSFFLTVLPGEHNVMGLPSYIRMVTNGFNMTESFATQEIKDYCYSWHEAFRDEVARYDDYGVIAFSYVDGKYIGIGSPGSKRKVVCDHAGGELISVDGKDPKDMCFEFLEIFHVCYDSGNDRFFRTNLIFNDGIGEKHTAEILMPDGSRMTMDIYEDPGFDLALMEKATAYPEMSAGSGEEVSSDKKVTDIWAADYVPHTYRIAEDAGRHLVYLDSYDCDLVEGERLVVDLYKAIENADADTVILDLRKNSGGDRDFCNKLLLPVLFSHDVEYSSKVIGKRNDYTKQYYENDFYTISMGRKQELDDEYFYYTETFNVEGKAKRDLKIYVLTSQTTFSSGDILTQLCSRYDKAVIVGTNTKGEGVSGSPFNCYLPESRFMFVYVPTINMSFPEDSYYGTEPDVYIHFTVEEFIKRRELDAQGVDVDEYNERMAWDQTLLKVLEMADND